MKLSFKQKLIIGIVGTLVILGVGIYIYTTNGGKEEYNFNDFYTNVEADEPKESTIIVHITGKVKNAGIIELPEESRISDAIKKAGGVKVYLKNQWSNIINSIKGKKVKP